MKTITATLIAALLSTAAYADHNSHAKGPDGQWLATFTLDAGANGCPIFWEVPATFVGASFIGQNANATAYKIDGTLDGHGNIKGWA